MLPIGLAIALLLALIICGVLPFYRSALGFLLGILVTLLVVIHCIQQNEPEVYVLAVILFLLTMTATAFSPRREYGSWPRILARWILTISLVIIVTIISYLVLGYGGSFGLFFAVMLISAIIGAVVTNELARSTFIITTIGSSMRQNLPLPLALEMAAGGRNDKRAFILRNIKKWLIEGYSLNESLKRGYPRCPAYVTALVAAGERIGQVPQAIAALEQDLTAKAYKNKKVRHIPAFYPPLVLLMIFIVTAFLLVFIIPKFFQLIKDMSEGGMRIPASMNILVQISQFFRSTTAGAVGLIIAVLALIIAVIYIRVKTRPRRPEKPYLVSRFGDFLKWHLPFFGFYEWTTAMQRVTGMLKLSLKAGCTVNEAISNTVGMDVNYCFQKNLKTWLKKVEQGGDIGQSAGQCGMGSGITWAFCDLSNHSNTLTILDTLETSYRWAYSRAAGAARAIIGPCETICLGLMVGFIMYAVISTMVAVINATASFVP